MSDRTDLADLLARSELFGAVSTIAKTELSEQMREVRFGQGKVIFSRGDPGEHLYIVAQGRVRVTLIASDGRELSFRIVAADQVFGEIAAIDGGRRSADAIALTPVRALSLDGAALKAICARRPEVSHAIILSLCRQVRKTSDQLENVAFYPVQVRLARFLLVSLRGVPRPGPGRRIPLDIGFSQSELAQLLGASRPKVNVALGRLERAGAIRRTSDRLFCDPEALARLADESSGAE